jgi:hypothetical protein
MVTLMIRNEGVGWKGSLVKIASAAALSHGSHGRESRLPACAG